MESAHKSQSELLEWLARGLAEQPDPEMLAEELLTQACRAVGAEAGSLMLFEPTRHELVFRAVVGPVATQLRGRGVAITEASLSGHVFLTGEPVAILDASSDERWNPRIDQGTGFQTRSLIIAPLTSGGKRTGVVELLNPFAGRIFESADLVLLQNLAGPIAVAMENARLLQELSNSYIETTRLLAAAVEAKDLATLGHIERVSSVAVQTARAIGLRGRELQAVEFGSILHDVGKVAVEGRVLLKAGPLSDPEWDEMRLHPIIGEKILSKSRFLESARLAVRHHHERWDGKGYPDGLAGDRIPLSARIVSIADAFDAMTSNRPYRDGMSEEAAAQRLHQGAGQHWDPRVVQAFLQLLRSGELVLEAWPRSPLTTS